MMQDITDTLAAGGRITPEQALYLAREAAPHAVWELARQDRVRRFGNDAFWVYNQHLNYTNVCANACRFCAFSKRAGDPAGYTLTPEQAAAKVRERAAEPIREIHIVGGLNPDLPYRYYLDLIGGVKAPRPQAPATPADEIRASPVRSWAMGSSADVAIADSDPCRLSGIARAEAVRARKAAASAPSWGRPPSATRCQASSKRASVASSTPETPR